MRPPRRPRLAGLVIGVAVGAALTGLALGVGVTHNGCSQGPVSGSSGDLAAPIALGVPPPGGLVNWSYTFGSEFGSMDRPSNSTLVDYTVLNWTAVTEAPDTLPGWGPNVACPELKLLTPSIMGGSCGGCLLAPGVPGGVGQRTIIPETTTLDSHLTPLLNGSYPVTPLGTFSWNITPPGTMYVNFEDLPEFAGNATPYEKSPTGPYAGLELHVSVAEVGFGVPIHLLNGTEVTLPSATPQWLPGSSLAIELTYIFPGPGDNRTWAMYAAGAGSPYPLGGYFFEELT